jgi:hypothetical protein
MNSTRKGAIIIVLAFITIALIMWVIWLGKKAQETVQVAVYAQGMYKNQIVTDPESQFEPYDMLKAEYEKLSVTYENGETRRRIMTWDEVSGLKGWYAAYPLMQGDYVQYRSFISTKTDNSNTVLYNFPGKEIVSFDIDTDLIGTFKTFLEPGDKINIQAIYSDTLSETKDDGYGNVTTEDVEVFRTEKAFNGITIADMLNSSDSSVLDMYAYYNQLSSYQQSTLDNDSSWQSSTQPAKILVALTPEELERYYYYKNKDAEFEVSLPQRTE